MLSIILYGFGLYYLIGSIAQIQTVNLLERSGFCVDEEKEFIVIKSLIGVFLIILGRSV